jgi:thiol-disulfide isomerase/thioredoxin
MAAMRESPAGERIVRRMFAAAALWVGMSATALAGDVVVMFSYADWCGPCQILKPKLESVVDGLPAGAAEIRYLDFTEVSAENLERQFDRAAPLIAEDFFRDGYLATGFAIVVADGAEAGRLSAGMTEDDIAMTIRGALER